MRIKKSAFSGINRKRKRTAKTPTLELDSWQFTTNDEGDLVVRNKESGDEIIVARKQ